MSYGESTLEMKREGPTDSVKLEESGRIEEVPSLYQKIFIRFSRN